MIRIDGRIVEHCRRKSWKGVARDERVEGFIELQALLTCYAIYVRKLMKVNMNRGITCWLRGRALQLWDLSHHWVFETFFGKSCWQGPSYYPWGPTTISGFLDFEKTQDNSPQNSNSVGAPFPQWDRLWTAGSAQDPHKTAIFCLVLRARLAA